MTKKYLPFIVLLAAALLLFSIKRNQRGTDNQPAKTNITVEAPPASTVETQQPADALPFNRNASHIIYTKHARCRMGCRHIDESEVKEIIATGKLNAAKIEEDSRGKTYPIEGETHDHQHVRIVIAPKPNDELVVVTVIDLGTEWSCDCK